MAVFLRFQFLCRALPLILYLLVVAACQSEPPTLAGFDAAAFRADKRACSGARQRLTPALNRARAQLVALPESQITTLFGRPDQADLGARGLRTYVYLLAPGPACGTQQPGQPPALRIAFDALDRVTEAVITTE